MMVSLPLLPGLELCIGSGKGGVQLGTAGVVDAV